MFYDPIGMGLDVARINAYEVIVHCPFHDDREPSATFNIANGMFHCFACGMGMGAKRLADSLGVSIVRSSLPVTPQAHRKNMREWKNVLLAPIAIDNPYLASRGITNDTIIERGIRDVGYGVAFVNYDVHRVPIGAQIRRYDDRPRYHFVGKRTPVWPVSVVAGPTLYVTEGVFGACHGLQAGFPTVAVMGATAIHAAARLLNGRRLRVVFDDDFAGYLGAAKFAYLCAASVAIPGRAADELDAVEWHAVVDGDWTSMLSTLAERSGDPARFSDLIDKFLRR